MKVFNHFGYDETNTPRETRMLIKVGGGGGVAGGGATAGFHWHMNIANKIWYYPSDEQHQVIPYFKVEGPDGKVKEYFAQSQEAPPSTALVEANLRRMDCVSCHNRPTHIYVPPDTSVDRALLASRIDRTLPYIKAEAVAALEAEYASTDEALAGIRTHLVNYYKANYPDVAASKSGAIEAADRGRGGGGARCWPQATGCAWREATAARLSAGAAPRAPGPAARSRALGRS